MNITEETRPTLTLIQGPMFAGKSTKLMEVWRGEADRAVCFKPSKDTRYSGNNFIESHNLIDRIPCTPIDSMRDIIGKIGTARTVIIDEIHFFNPIDVDYTIREIMFHPYQGQSVVVAGVNKNHKGVTFPVMAMLQRMADNIIDLTAFCSDCRNHDGIQSVRLEEFDQEAEIIVGGAEAYKTLCSHCYSKHLGKIGKTHVQ